MAGKVGNRLLPWRQNRLHRGDLLIGSEFQTPWMLCPVWMGVWRGEKEQVFIILLFLLKSKQYRVVVQGIASRLVEVGLNHGGHEGFGSGYPLVSSLSSISWFTSSSDEPAKLRTRSTRFFAAFQSKWNLLPQ